MKKRKREGKEKEGTKRDSGDVLFIPTWHFQKNVGKDPKRDKRIRERRTKKPSCQCFLLARASHPLLGPMFDDKLLPWVAGSPDLPVVAKKSKSQSKSQDM